MEFDEWAPIYETILDDFGYDRSEDEAARDWLAAHVQAFDLDRLDVEGTVAVAGAAPRLEADLATARAADAVVAASDAGSRLAARGVEPSLVVTDLDGEPSDTVALARDGVPIAVHAHGDNQDLLRRWIPELPEDAILGTTQAEPRDPLVNVGGFTDGDRAAFLADALGADQLAFPGWAFDVEDAEKRRKLQWAARLLHWLERRRDEQFDVLDGIREDLDPSELPPP